MLLHVRCAQLLPRLSAVNYVRTSRRTRRYNCIAWAAGDDTRRWDMSVHAQGAYWPPGVVESEAVEALVSVFESIGYSRCSDTVFEEGFEKVAIYGRDGNWRHVARQLADGTWTSKLGELDDITHLNVEALVGPYYGQVVAVLRRPFRR